MSQRYLHVLHELDMIRRDCEFIGNWLHTASRNLEESLDLDWISRSPSNERYTIAEYLGKLQLLLFIFIMFKYFIFLEMHCELRGLDMTNALSDLVLLAWKIRTNTIIIEGGRQMQEQMEDSATVN